jgi:hypothetical protein
MTEVTAVGDGRLRTRNVVTEDESRIEGVDTVVLANGGETVDWLRAPLLDGARIGRSL